jgi:hypothetical protein
LRCNLLTTWFNLLAYANSKRSKIEKSEEIAKLEDSLISLFWITDSIPFPIGLIVGSFGLMVASAVLFDLNGVFAWCLFIYCGGDSKYTFG